MPDFCSTAIVSQNLPVNAQGVLIVDISSLEFVPIGTHTRILDLSTVQTITPPTGATKLLIQARQGDVRFTLDNTNPIAGAGGLGFVLYASAAPTTIPVRSTSVIKLLADTTGANAQYQWGS